jgi:general secretion pathway protein D
MKHRVFLFALAALFVSGCATDSTYREGERLIQEGRTREGLDQLGRAVKSSPDNLQYRATYYRTLDAELGKLNAQAVLAVNKGDLDAAAGRYGEMLKLHPEDARASAGLAVIDVIRRNPGLVLKAKDAVARNDLAGARVILRTVLTQSPGDREALALLKEIDEREGTPQGGEMPHLGAEFQKRVSVEFRSAPVRSVCDVLAGQTGVNFVFDHDVRPDQMVTVVAHDTPISDVLDLLLTSGQLTKKVLNSKTVLIYPDQPAKRKAYEEQVVRAFFLTNLDAKGAMNMVRTMTRNNDLYVDEKRNILYVRGTPQAIEVVKKLVDVADQPDPEVMLDVEVLEVSRSKLLDLGVQWPNQFSVLNQILEQNQTINAAGGTIATSAQYINVPQTLNLLAHVNSSSIGISPTPTINFGATDGDVNILANPRIRVRNMEKATIHIGDKVPVITSNVTATGVTSESVSYLDVGLKFEVQPRVHLDGEVDMKVELEVSDIAQQIQSANGTVTYQLGNRNANTVLQLKDGETQVLAGLISDEDRKNMSKLPGLSDIPLLGHLFSDHHDSKKKTEIVLLITPHVLRNVERPSLAKSEFFVGTDDEPSAKPRLLGPMLERPVPVQGGQAVPGSAAVQPGSGAKPAGAP